MEEKRNQKTEKLKVYSLRDVLVSSVSSIIPDIQITATNGATVNTDYHGPFVYERSETPGLPGLITQSKPTRINTPHGFVSGDTAYYYITDRRGSVRQVINGTTGDVTRQYHYYPYGGHFGESTAEALIGKDKEAAPRFGGKELRRCASLSFLDFPARPYDYSLLQFWTDDPLREKYYGFSPRLFCLGNPISYTDPTGMRPTEDEAARMADYSYEEEAILTGGWKISNITQFNVNNQSGLKSILFERASDGGEKEYALGFAGTQLKDTKDIINDVLQVIGMSEQYEEAMELAEKISVELGDSELTFLGHSLGGGLSAACAYATDGNAMIFNPAGVSILTIRQNTKAKIDSYITVTDPLNFCQSRIIYLPKADGTIHYRMPRTLMPFGGHSISNFYGPTLGDKFIDGCNKVIDNIKAIKSLF